MSTKTDESTETTDIAPVAEGDRVRAKYSDTYETVVDVFESKINGTRVELLEDGRRKTRQAGMDNLCYQAANGIIDIEREGDR